MSHLLEKIYNWIGVVTDRAPLCADERLRLQHYTVFLALGAPTMLTFAIFSMVRGEMQLGASVASCVAGLFLGWALIRHGLKPVVIFRLNGALFAGLLVYLAAVGGEQGSKILWSYSFPLIAFFLFGRREGWFWVATTVFLQALILLGLLPLEWTFPYDPEFQLRYLITILFVTVISFWFEYFREEYRRRAEAEHKRLGEALAQVKALSGLLPICSACKKIRDDQGYWNQIESYIHQHSEARFSHGICPDCMTELYPEMASELDTPTEN